MKKLILVTLLIVMLAVPFCVSGTCLAEDNGKLYYYASEEIPVYKDTQGNSLPVFMIPATYAYQFDSEVTGTDYIKISYNGKEGYINKTAHKSTNQIKLDWQNNYFYNISFNVTATDEINIYSYEENGTSLSPEPAKYIPSTITVTKVYSYDRIDGEYYFYVHYKFQTLLELDGYIKAGDTSLSSFSIESIPQNPNYIEETTPETPSGDNGGGTTNEGIQEPTNNLERYLLIAVIAVLCVVIVVLIFLPNKNRKVN